MEAGKLNLPERINHHPAHGHSALNLHQYYLRSRTVNRAQCDMCLNMFKEGDYVYVCDNCSDADCDFTVDIACSSIKARVDFRDHEHSLFFFERLNGLRCHSCERPSNVLMFRCLTEHCHYGLHLSCGPLPIAIQCNHSGHEMTLTLKDTLLNGAGPEDSWCDICEQQRDPMKCVYHSEDHEFTAAIECVLPQIVGALQGHHGEVKLRSVRGHSPGTVRVTAKGSTKQESREEKSMLHGDAEEVIFGKKMETNAADIEKVVYSTSNGYNIFGILPREDQELMQCFFTEVIKRGSAARISRVVPFKFSDEAFKQFKEYEITGNVDFSFLFFSRLLEGELHFVKVGSNLILRELAPLYLQVTNKHGDFTAGSPLSPAGKALLIMWLLNLIQNTQGLQICEMTGDLLCSLQFYLGVPGENLGFDVKFALDNLEHVARAYYALKFVKARDNITTDLTQKIEQLKREIHEDKPKIEALKEQYRRGKESEFVKQCLAEASAVQWKNAGEFLGMDEE